VKLTVVHDGFDPDSTAFGLINQGWTIKLSNLKSMLEQPSDGVAQSQDVAVAPAPRRTHPSHLPRTGDFA
jgi:hypothetical protein